MSRLLGCRPGEEAAQELGAGAANALGAAAPELSAELSLNALMGTKAAASLARGPSSSQPLAGRVPSREISLGAMPRQSSAPQTPNISARCGFCCPGSCTPPTLKTAQ